MPTEQVYAPGILVPLTFDPTADLLGSGTVGEVFKVTLHKYEISTIAVRPARRGLRTQSD
jgi:hypothetical protein